MAHKCSHVKIMFVMPLDLTRSSSHHHRQHLFFGHLPSRRPPVPDDECVMGFEADGDRCAFFCPTRISGDPHGSSLRAEIDGGKGFSDPIDRSVTRGGCIIIIRWQMNGLPRGWEDGFREEGRGMRWRL